ncbi:MAG: tyrosine-type recombinase/integrase [Thermodesulfobacteriota bacterium]
MRKLTLGKKTFERGLRRKKAERQPPYVPTQKEVLGIIESISSKRTKLAVMLAYSAGFDIEEVISLKITDIDFEKNIIRIPLKKNRGMRKAVLAEYVKPYLFSYIRDKSPSKWALGGNNGEKISASAIQRSVKKAVKTLGIKNEITVKSLKYAYVKHLEALGGNLLGILDELGLSLRYSFEFYAKLGQKIEKVSISPIDRRLTETATRKPVLFENEFVSEKRINELAEISSAEYDLTKLLELLREINVSYRYQMYLSIAMLVRSVMDHIPPIFGTKKFSEIANNYEGTRSFKKSMLHLNNSLRNVADSFLHTPVRRAETLPSFVQVDFRADVDVLLSEVVITIRKKT